MDFVVAMFGCWLLHFCHLYCHRVEDVNWFITFEATRFYKIVNVVRVCGVQVVCSVIHWFSIYFLLFQPQCLLPFVPYARRVVVWDARWAEKVPRKWVGDGNFYRPCCRWKDMSIYLLVLTYSRFWVVKIYLPFIQGWFLRTITQNLLISTIFYKLPPRKKQAMNNI